MATGSEIRAGGAFVEFYAKGNQAVQRALDGMQARMQSMGKAFMLVGATISAAGVAIVAPLLAATLTFANMASDMLDASQRTGLTVEALSELQYVALQSGASVEELETAIKKMQQTLVDAADGAQPAIKALESLGLVVADFHGLSGDKQLELIAEKIAGIDNPAQRTAAALEIFGKSGTRMLPMLMESSAGIRRLREEAQRLGITMRTADAVMGEGLGDQLSLLKKLGQMVFFNIGAALAPIMSEFVGHLIEGLGYVNRFVAENRGLVRMVLTVGLALAGAGAALTAIGMVVYTAAYAFGLLAGVISVVSSVIGHLVILVRFAQIGFGILGLASMAWSAATAVASGIASLAIGGFNAVVATAHFLVWGLKLGLIALGVTAALVGLAINLALLGIFVAPLIFLGYFVSKWVAASEFIQKQWAAFTTALAMQWQALKSVIGPVIEYVGQLFGAMGEVAMGYLRPIANWFTGTLFPMIGRIAGYFSAAFSATAANFSTMASGLISTAGQTWTGLLDAFAVGDMTLVWEIIQAAAILAWTQIVAFIEPTWHVWRDAITDTFTEVWTLLRSMFTTGWAFVAGGFWDLAGTILESLEPVITATRTLLEGLAVIDPTGAATAALDALGGLPDAPAARLRAAEARQQGTTGADAIEREAAANWFDEQAARIVRDMAVESGNEAAIADAQAQLDALTNEAWQQRAMQDYIAANFGDAPLAPDGGLGGNRNAIVQGTFNADAVRGFAGSGNPLEGLAREQRDLLAQIRDAIQDQDDEEAMG